MPLKTIVSQLDGLESFLLFSSHPPFADMPQAKPGWIFIRHPDQLLSRPPHVRSLYTRTVASQVTTRGHFLEWYFQLFELEQHSKHHRDSWHGYLAHAPRVFGGFSTVRAIEFVCDGRALVCGELWRKIWSCFCHHLGRTELASFERNHSEEHNGRDQAPLTWHSKWLCRRSCTRTILSWYGCQQYLWLNNHQSNCSKSRPRKLLCTWRLPTTN